jgi:hypothetical protein
VVVVREAWKLSKKSLILKKLGLMPEVHSFHHAEGIKHGQSLQFENNRKDIPKVGKNRRWRVIIFEYKKYDDGNRVE